LTCSQEILLKVLPRICTGDFTDIAPRLLFCALAARGIPVYGVRDAPSVNERKSAQCSRTSQ
jgi:hypothetical protein